MSGFFDITPNDSNCDSGGRLDMSIRLPNTSCYPPCAHQHPIDGVGGWSVYASDSAAWVGKSPQWNGTQFIPVTVGGGSGTVTSVAASITGALAVAGSPITTSGTLAFTWTGNSGQYVLGDGTLATKITNNNQLINGENFITLTSLSGTSPISYNSGTGEISTSMATNKLIGRGTAGTGVMEEITLGTGLSFTGTTLNVSGFLTSAITSLNGLTAATQTFTNDTNVTIVSAGSTHTITWSGTLAATRGGTGFGSYTVGDLLQSDTTTTLSKLAAVATGNALISGGVGTVSSWGKIGLTTHVSGILPPANGGTGVANNNSSTITISGNFATTFVVPASQSYTFQSGSYTLAGTNISNNFSSTNTMSAASVVSVAALYFTGAWYSGGTSTTTKPHVLIEQSGFTTSSNWSTSGTGLGINAAAAFTGNYIDCHLNGGSSLFKVASTGVATAIGLITQSITGSITTSTIEPSSSSGAWQFKAFSGTANGGSLLFSGGSQMSAATAGVAYSTIFFNHGVNITGVGIGSSATYFGIRATPSIIIDGTTATGSYTFLSYAPSTVTLLAGVGHYFLRNQSTSATSAFGTATAPTAFVHIGAGTSSIPPLQLITATPTTGTPLAGSLEYNTPQLFFTNGGLQRQEIPQIQQSRVTSQFDKTNTTLADVTSLTATLVAGKSYYFEANLYIDADAVGGSKYAIAGTATATSIRYQIQLFDNSTNGLTINTRQTALAGSSGQASTTAGFCKITGLIVCNAAGTLTVQFAQNAANGTSSVLTASNFITREIL